MNKLLLLFFFLYASLLFSQDESATRIEYQQHGIVTRYYSSDGPINRGRSDETLESLLVKYRRLPATPQELLDTLLVRFHPNEIILDDFDISNIRFHENYQNYFVVF